LKILVAIMSENALKEKKWGTLFIMWSRLRSPTLLKEDKHKVAKIDNRAHPEKHKVTLSKLRLLF